ncbi:palmitoyl-protein hydrolase [Malassezia nana]|uniref:Palmitoyl-protein thioesterase 1 n=1 Tax=Malassezia nana TaxID=180528 RepID=A0AAF0EIN5_9BASI|nr:palmitoyl-protein hydrolase [Malassezia nana]
MAHGRFEVARRRRPWPVVLWHGLGDAAQSEWMQHTKKTLEEMHPGLFVHVIALEQSEWRDRRATVWGHVPTQISQVHEQLQTIPELRDGFDAVGFSQGGQFLRGYVERFNDPPVRHLLTFGSQHMGITELPECSVYDALCHAVHGALSTRVYSDYAQHHVVTAQYFRDTRTPAQWALYHAKNAFLRDINNEGEHKNETYKKNMLSLQSFVMVQFDEETTVRPANSSWFESFPAPAPGVIPTHTVPLRDSKLYREDWIGLRALDARGSLVFLRRAPGTTS